MFLSVAKKQLFRGKSKTPFKYDGLLCHGHDSNANFEFWNLEELLRTGL